MTEAGFGSEVNAPPAERYGAQNTARPRLMRRVITGAVTLALLFGELSPVVLAPGIRAGFVAAGRWTMESSRACADAVAVTDRRRSASSTTPPFMDFDGEDWIESVRWPHRL